MNKKESFRLVGLIFIVICLITSIGLFIGKRNAQNTRAIKGELYMTEEQRDQITFLNGDWAFAWKEFYSTAEFEAAKKAGFGEKWDYVKVPGMWNRYIFPKSSEENQPKAFGYGTFHLKVKGLIPNKEYAIKLPTFGTSGKVFVNDVLLKEAGKIGKSKEEYEPRYEITIIYFTPDTDSVDIIVQVSNYDYSRGGIWLPIKMAEKEVMQRYVIMEKGKEYFVFAVAMAVLLIGLLFFIFVQKSKNLLYFLICDSIIILYLMSCGNKLIIEWIPSITMRQIVVVQYLVMFLAPPAFLLYITQMVTFAKGKIIIYILVVHGIVFSIASIFMPISILTKFTYFNNAIAYISLLYYVYAVLVAVKKNYRDGYILLVAGMILGVTVVHDLLYGAAIIHSYFDELMDSGFCIVILCMGLISFFRIARIRLELERIKGIEQAYLNAQIKPHFLYNALNTIVSLLPPEAEEVEDLILSLSTYLRGTLEFKNTRKLVTLEREMKMVRAYLSIEKARFPDIQITISHDLKEEVFVPPLTIQPLVENAIKHGLRRGEKAPKLYIGMEKIKRGLQIKVVDNGVGIDPPTMEKLYERLNILSLLMHEPEEMQSIGLYNVHIRLHRAFGEGLVIESEEGKGTAVSFVVPNKAKILV